MGSHNALGLEERYHSYLCQTYLRIRLASPEILQELALSLALKVIKDTAGPEGLSPTLIVFGVVPRIPVRLKDLRSQVNRMNTIRTVTDELSKIVAVHQIKVALSKISQQDADSVIGIGDEVLMFREKPVGKWAGPYLVTYGDD